MDDGQYFIASANQYAPIASGIPFRPMGMVELPFGNGNPMLNMALQPVLQNMMGSVGFAPMSQNTNVYDTLVNQRQWRQQMDLQRSMAELDKENWIRTMRGMAHMTGTPWGAEQMRASRGLADLGAFASPMLQMMMPDLLDEMSGSRGSASVMAGRMMMAGRYQLDPNTGRLGREASTVAAQAKSLYNDFYGGDMSSAKGVSAGQMGQLYEQLTLKGMMPSDNQQSRNTLKSYLDAVNAVKDIFGGLGQPDAPMPQLIAALEKLTNGSIGRFDPGKISTMVRTTEQLANVTSIGLDNAVRLQEHASARASQMGLDPIFGILAGQGGMAAGGAYRELGVGGVAAWGKMNVEQFTQLDTNLRVNAASSRMANRMGLAMRLADRFGGFEAGSEASAYVDALRSAQDTGADSFTFGGRSHSLNLSDKEFFGMFGRSKLANGQMLGLDATALEGMMGQRFTNQQFIAEYNLGDVARRAQGRSDVQPWLSRQMGNYMASSMVGHGVSREQALAAMKSAGGSIASRIMGLSPDAFASDASRNAAMTLIMKEELGKTDAGRTLAGKLGAGADQFYANSAERFYGYWNEVIRYSPDFSDLGSAQNMFLAFNDSIQRGASNIQVQERMTSKIRDAVSPLNRGSKLRRVVSYLQNLKEGDEDMVAGLISTGIGGVKVDDIKSGVMPVMKEVRKRQEKLEALQLAIQQAGPGGEVTVDGKKMAYSAAQAEFGNQVSQLKAWSGKAVDALSRVGYSEDALSDKETITALNWAARTDSRGRSAMDMIRGLDALTGPDGKALTPAQRHSRFAAFFSGDDGKFFHETVRGQGQSAEDVAMRALMSKGTLERIGMEGIEESKKIRSANQSLRELALIYSGGDIGRLMAGDLDPALSEVKRNEIMARSQGLATDRTAAVQHLHTMVTAGGVKQRTPEESAAIQKAAGVVLGSELMSSTTLAKNMADEYGVFIANNDRGDSTLQGIASLLSSEHGRGIGFSLLSGHRAISQIGRESAKRKLLASGVSGAALDKAVAGRNDAGYFSDMYKAYRDAKGNKTLDKFRSAFGMDSKSYNDFETMMEMQISSGFAELGTGELGGPQLFDSGTAMQQKLSRVLSGAQMGNVSVNIPDKITIDGKVDVDGNISGTGTYHSENANSLHSNPTSTGERGAK